MEIKKRHHGVPSTRMLVFYARHVEIDDVTCAIAWARTLLEYHQVHTDFVLLSNFDILKSESVQDYNNSVDKATYKVGCAYLIRVLVKRISINI